MRLKVLIVLITLLQFVSIAVCGQSEVGQVSKSLAGQDSAEKFTEVRNRLRGPLPFQPGERLSYELRLSRFPIYGLIGLLTFKVNEQQEETGAAAETARAASTATSAPAGQPAAVPSDGARTDNARPGVWKIFVEAQSKGFLTSLFGVKVNDEFVSYVDRADFGVVKTSKKIEEGRRRREDTADFDRARQLVKWTGTDLNNPKQATQTKEKETLGWVTDIVSGWYVLRAQQFAIGKSIAFPLSDNGETYEIEVDPLEREHVEIDLGKFSTLKLDMKIFDGKFIKRKGKLYLWVTDDDRHLPVRAQIKSNFGTVTVTLIEMEKVKTV